MKKYILTEEDLGSMQLLLIDSFKELGMCKDCKYSDTFSDMTAEPHSQLKCLGIKYGGVEPMWYCEHGKRKEE